MGWGISKKATPKEKIKAEMADFLNGENCVGDITIKGYDKLYDLFDELLDNIYWDGYRKKIVD